MEFIKKFFRKEFLILTLIVFIGGVLRLYKLDKIPSGFYVDEAAIGYNAYSLLLTGKDEYGKSFPVFLRSYGLVSPPLYTYLTVIPIKVFGLSIYSVRVLSSISGIMSIVFVYLILKKLKIFRNNYVAYIGTFLFAVSPWSIFFSRGAFEANFAFLLILVVVYFLLLCEEQLIYLVPAAAVASISTHAYQAERLIVYVLLGGFVLMLVLRKKIKSFFVKEVICALIVFLLIQAPQLFLLLTPSFGSRAVGLFYKSAILRDSIRISHFLPDIVVIPLAFLREFLSQFTSYFSPRNLFWEGDSDLQRSLPALSVFYSWMIAPYLIGFYLFLKSLKEVKYQFVLLMLVSFVLPAALTGDPFSTLRSQPLLLPLLVIICLGIDFFIQKLSAFPLVMIGVTLIFISAIYFWRSYFVLLPSERATIWGYGYNQLADEIKKRPEEKFIVDESRSKPSYIELLFFLKYPPAEFHKIINPDIRNNYYTNLNFDTSYAFANIETRNITWEKDIYKNQILVGDEFAVSEKQAKEHFLTIVFEIRDPLDNVVFRGYKTNPKEKCANISQKNPLCNN